MDRILGRLLAAWTGLAIVALSAATADPQTAAQDAAPAKYLLRYKFRPGDTLRWKVVHRATVDATVSGVSQMTEAVTVSTKVWKVRKVDASGILHLTAELVLATVIAILKGGLGLRETLGEVAPSFSL